MKNKIIYFWKALIWQTTSDYGKEVINKSRKEFRGF